MSHNANAIGGHIGRLDPVTGAHSVTTKGPFSPAAARPFHVKAICESVCSYEGIIDTTFGLNVKNRM